MRSELVDAIEDKARQQAMRTLGIHEALPLTEREESLLTVAIRAGIGASLAVISGEIGHG